MDKLQELTDKLYGEGLSKGKAEGEALLAEARKKAAEIKAEAEKEAQAIKTAAEKDAEDLRSRTAADVRKAAGEALSATKNDLEKLVVAKMTSGVKETLSSPDYLKEIITEVAKKFNAEESSDLSIVLPESLRNELEPFVNGELSKILGKGLDARFSKAIGGGFNIGPKDGGYYISLSEETFRELIGEYLRPATKKLLFGE
jgi:V/A-type H+-transporting ATPase subunit E